jgi:hypothetical protein
MKIAIMQPYIFPYIGYFQLINAVDKFVIYDDVNYIKKGWINRNNFLSNGKIHRFTIPLINASQNRLIKDTQISKTENWEADLLNTISNSYKKAPCFDVVFGIIKEILSQDEHNIAKYNHSALLIISKYLEIETEFLFSSELNKDNALKGSAKIVDICKILNATDYINPIGGLELYSKENFLMEKIELKFLKSNVIEYKQFEDEFIPWLSIIDVLMFNSKNEVKNLLNEYTLV